MVNKIGGRTGGKKPGYRHYTVQCARCGAWVMDNWLMRHYNSKCKVGIHHRGEHDQKTV